LVLEPRNGETALVISTEYLIHNDGLDLMCFSCTTVVRHCKTCLTLELARF